MTERNDDADDDDDDNNDKPVSQAKMWVRVNLLHKNSAFVEQTQSSSSKL